jgi:hypothetical protein
MSVNEPGLEPQPQGAVAFEVTSLGRRRRRIDPGLVIVGLSLILVVAAIARPWASGQTPPAAVTNPSPPAGQPSAAALVRSSPSPESAAVDPNARSQPGLVPVIRDLAGSSGRWGVGVAGLAPVAPSASSPASASTIRATGWSAWVGVRPATSSQAPVASGDLPGGTANELCAGLPSLPTGAEVVAITAPTGPLADFHVAGWWVSDVGDNPAQLTPVAGLRQITPSATGDITYLQLTDNAVWPDGRYEFQVGGTADATTLTVCLGQP